MQSIPKSKVQLKCKKGRFDASVKLLKNLHMQSSRRAACIISAALRVDLFFFLLHESTFNFRYSKICQNYILGGWGGGGGGRVTEEQKKYQTQFYGGTASTLLHATEDQNIKYKNKSKYGQSLCQNIKGIGSND